MINNSKFGINMKVLNKVKYSEKVKDQSNEDRNKLIRQVFDIEIPIEEKDEINYNQSVFFSKSFKINDHTQYDSVQSNYISPVSSEQIPGSIIDYLKSNHKSSPKISNRKSNKGFIGFISSFLGIDIGSSQYKNNQFEHKYTKKSKGVLTIRTINRNKESNIRKFSDIDKKCHLQINDLNSSSRMFYSKKRSYASSSVNMNSNDTKHCMKDNEKSIPNVRRIFSSTQKNLTNNLPVSEKNCKVNDSTLLYIPCINCGDLIHIDFLEEHSNQCFIFKSEIITSESIVCSITCIDDRLIRLKSHVNMISDKQKSFNKEIHYFYTLSHALEEAILLNEINNSNLILLKKLLLNLDVRRLI